MDADAHVERRVGRPRLDEREARVHGALGRVVEGARPAEVGEEPVAQVLRHVAPEALDRLVRPRLVAAHQRAIVLGVEAPRELGRAHQVAEEHGELAALAFAALPLLLEFG